MDRALLFIGSLIPGNRFPKPGVRGSNPLGGTCFSRLFAFFLVLTLYFCAVFLSISRIVINFCINFVSTFKRESVKPHR